MGATETSPAAQITAQSAAQSTGQSMSTASSNDSGNALFSPSAAPASSPLFGGGMETGISNPGANGAFTNPGTIESFTDPGFGDTDLLGPVGFGEVNWPGDVAKVQGALKQGGFYGGALDGQYGPLTETGIKTAQAGPLGQDLVDGLINPGGPSETAFRGLMGSTTAKVDPADNPQTLARSAQVDAHRQAAPIPGVPALGEQMQAKQARENARVAAAQAGTPAPRPNPRPNPGAGALNGALGNAALGNGIAGDAFGSTAEIKVPKFKMPSPPVPSPKPPVSPKADLGALLPPEVRAQVPLIKSALPPAKTGSSGGKTPFQDRPLDRLAINHERRAGGLAPVDWRAVDQGKAAYLRDGEHTRPLNPALKVRPVTDLAGDLRRDLVAAARSGDPAAVPRVLNRRLTQAKRIQALDPAQAQAVERDLADGLGGTLSDLGIDPAELARATRTPVNPTDAGFGRPDALKPDTLKPKAARAETPEPSRPPHRTDFQTMEMTPEMTREMMQADPKDPLNPQVHTLPHRLGDDGPGSRVPFAENAGDAEADKSRADTSQPGENNPGPSIDTSGMDAAAGALSPDQARQRELERQPILDSRPDPLGDLLPEAPIAETDPETAKEAAEIYAGIADGLAEHGDIPAEFERDLRGAMRDGNPSDVARVREQMTHIRARDEDLYQKFSPEMKQFHAAAMEKDRSALGHNPSANAHQQDRQAAQADAAGREAAATRHMGKAMVQGAVESNTDVLRGMGAITGQDGPVKAADAIDDAFAKANPIPQGFEKTDAVRDVRATGEAIADLAGGGAVGGLTKAGVKQGSKLFGKTVTRQTGTKAGVAAGGTHAAAGGAQTGAKAAKDAGGNKTQQQNAAVTGALIGTGTKPLGKASAKRVNAVLSRYLGGKAGTLPKGGIAGDVVSGQVEKGLSTKSGKVLGAPIEKSQRPKRRTR